MQTSFSSHKNTISSYLTDFLQLKRRELKKSHSLAGDVFDRLIKFSLGSKMLRGSLLIETYRHLGSQAHVKATAEISEQAVRAAAAQELAGSALLIHDDIMDQDELRRGGESIHTQYQSWAEKQSFPDAEQVGESLGICAGDLCFFLSFELLAGLKVDSKIRQRLTALFSRELSAVALGQMQDIELALTKREVTEKEIINVFVNKTGRYTFCLSLIAGAVLAGRRDKKVIQQLDQLGEVLSIIFQIKDDELDLFGAQSKIGKSAGSDVREGKKTLYYYQLMKLLKGSERSKLKNFFGKQDLTQGELELVRTAVKESGAKELVDSKLKQLATEARELIDKLPASDDYKEFLKDFLNLMLIRKR